jgi:hypothetical protein
MMEEMWFYSGPIHLNSFNGDFGEWHATLQTDDPTAVVQWVTANSTGLWCVRQSPSEGRWLIEIKMKEASDLNLFKQVYKLT